MEPITFTVDRPDETALVTVLPNPSSGGPHAGAEPKAENRFGSRRGRTGRVTGTVADGVVPHTKAL